MTKMKGGTSLKYTVQIVMILWFLTVIKNCFKDETMKAHSRYCLHLTFPFVSSNFVPLIQVTGLNHVLEVHAISGDWWELWYPNWSIEVIGQRYRNRSRNRIISNVGSCMKSQLYNMDDKQLVCLLAPIHNYYLSLLNYALPSAL